MLHDTFGGLSGKQNVLLAGYVALEDRGDGRERSAAGRAHGGLAALTHQFTDSIQVIQEVFD